MKWLLRSCRRSCAGVERCARRGGTAVRVKAGSSFDDARVSLVARRGAVTAPVDDDVTVRDGDRVRRHERRGRRSGCRDGRRILLHGGSRPAAGAPARRFCAGDVDSRCPARSPDCARRSSRASSPGHGAARIRSGLGVTAGVYRGSARAAAAGQTLDVPAYRQASSARLGLVPDRPRPSVHEDDRVGPPLPRRRPSSSTEDLQARSDGFSRPAAQGEGRTLGFYRLLFPQLEQREPGMRRRLLGDLTRPPGENLVGTSIALESDRAASRSAARPPSPSATRARPGASSPSTSASTACPASATCWPTRLGRLPAGGRLRRPAPPARRSRLPPRWTPTPARSAGETPEAATPSLRRRPEAASDGHSPGWRRHCVPGRVPPVPGLAAAGAVRRPTSPSTRLARAAARSGRPTSSAKLLGGSRSASRRGYRDPPWRAGGCWSSTTRRASACSVASTSSSAATRCSRRPTDSPPSRWPAASDPT